VKEDYIIGGGSLPSAYFIYRKKWLQRLAIHSV